MVYWREKWPSREKVGNTDVGERPQKWTQTSLMKANCWNKVMQKQPTRAKIQEWLANLERALTVRKMTDWLSWLLKKRIGRPQVLPKLQKKKKKLLKKMCSAFTGAAKLLLNKMLQPLLWRKMWPRAPSSYGNVVITELSEIFPFLYLVIFSGLAQVHNTNTRWSTRTFSSLESVFVKKNCKGSNWGPWSSCCRELYN